MEKYILFFFFSLQKLADVLLRPTKWIGCLIKEVFSNSPCICLISFCEMTRIGKSTEMENRLVVARDSARSAREETNNGYGFLSTIIKCSKIDSSSDHTTLRLY